MTSGQPFPVVAACPRRPQKNQCVLTEENGSSAGTAQLLTDCGAKVMPVNAKLE